MFAENNSKGQAPPVLPPCAVTLRLMIGVQYTAQGWWSEILKVRVVRYVVLVLVLVPYALMLVA